MDKNSTALNLYVRLAASKDAMPALVQEELARAGSASKTVIGDKVLANLAVRPDLADSVKKIVSSSPRASVKVAWLSRTDHPVGYVEAAIAKEKRVTVLSAVAEHPDATPQIVEVLADLNQPAVANALLTRSEISETALVKAILSAVSAGNLSWNARHRVSEAIRRNPACWPALSKTARTKQQLSFLLEVDGFTFEESDLARVTDTVLDGWRKEADRYAGTRWHAYEFSRPAARLLAQPGWEPYSEADARVADVMVFLRDTSTYFRADTAASDCITRHHGTAKQKADAEKRRKERARRIATARVTDDEKLLASMATGRIDGDLSAALAENPNLRLRHLINSDAVPLVMVCLSRGEDPVEGAAVLVANGQDASSLTSAMTDEQMTAVGRRAMTLLHAREQKMAPWRLTQMMRNEPRLISGAMAELTAEEIRELLDADYTEAEVRDTALTAFMSLLVNDLGDAEKLRTFTALLDEMQCSLTEAVNVAKTL